MADPNPSDDRLIEQAETAEERSRREERAATLFDVRRIIGGLFLLYGLVLFVLGLGASQSDMDRAAGVNVNLWVGLALLAFGAGMIAWALVRPLGRELAEAEARRTAP